MRLGILTSHPIQYQAPWFRGLAEAVDLEVFFAHRQTAVEQAEAGFGVAFDWDVDLLCGYQNRFLQNESRRPSVNHFFGCDTPEIREIIAAADFDAFIVSGWHLKSYWQAVRACRRTGVPVLVRGDSQLPTPRSLLKRWTKAIAYRILLRQFDGFLVVGKRNANYLLHYGVPKAKMFSAPHFVDREWFTARTDVARQTRRQTRAGWGASDAELVVLFVGKFIPKKRPTDLLQAMASAKRDVIPLVGVFVGSGELETQMREMAAREDLRVHFAGFKNQSELPEYYAAADVLVLPSAGGETWGLVVNEAMTCGLPAIVSDAVGCAPDLIDDGITGFTFRVSDSNQLAQRLATLLEMKRRGHDFQSALLQKTNAYSVEVAVSGTLKAVETMAAAS